MSEEEKPVMFCPECGSPLQADGACYNTKEKSGYQCYCEKCEVWWVAAVDGNYYKDEFLTLVVQPRSGGL